MTDRGPDLSVTLLGATVVSIMATATAPPTAAAIVPQPGEPQERQNPRRPMRPPDDEAEEEEAAAPRQYPLIDLPAGAFPPPELRGEGKLDSAIERLHGIYTQQSSAAALVFANRHGIQWRGGSLFVRIATGLPMPGLRPRDASSRAIVESVLADLAVEGSRIRNVYGPHIEAWIPVDAIPRLELNPGIRSIRKALAHAQQRHERRPRRHRRE